MTDEQRVLQRTYGFCARTRADVLAQLEAALDVTFEKRESAYLGEYEAYPPAQPGNIEPESQSSLLLRDNFDPLDEMPAREDRPDVAVLLEVSSSSPRHADEMQNLICGRLGGQRLHGLSGSP